MPKAIDNIREELLEETRRQLAEKGYSDLTMRAVAKECKVAVGTMYNYFPSKESLIGSVVLEDWKSFYAVLEKKIQNTNDVRSGLEEIYTGILKFIEDHHDLFYPDANYVSSYTYSGRHIVIIERITGILNIVFKRFSVDIDDFTVNFIAENFLRCSIKPYEYDLLWTVIKKLITQEENQ